METPLKNKGPADIDYVVVRENTGDLYTGVGGFSMKGTPHEVAVQSGVYSRFQVDPLPQVRVRPRPKAWQEKGL